MYHTPQCDLILWVIYPTSALTLAHLGAQSGLDAWLYFFSFSFHAHRISGEWPLSIVHYKACMWTL